MRQTINNRQNAIKQNTNLQKYARGTEPRPLQPLQPPCIRSAARAVTARLQKSVITWTTRAAFETVYKSPATKGLAKGYRSA